jgi:regulator of RNase E activity RraA
VTVSGGDLVIADDSGVVFVPADRAEEVLAAGEAVVEREAAISADIRAGVRIDQAMHDARLAGHTDTEQESQAAQGEGR